MTKEFHPYLSSRALENFERLHIFFYLVPAFKKYFDAFFPACLLHSLFMFI